MLLGSKGARKVLEEPKIGSRISPRGTYLRSKRVERVKICIETEHFSRSCH